MNALHHQQQRPPRMRMRMRCRVRKLRPLKGVAHSALKPRWTAQKETSNNWPGVSLAEVVTQQMPNFSIFHS
eukprot:5132794-Karenia_brevis.AAC.1